MWYTLLDGSEWVIVRVRVSQKVILQNHRHLYWNKIPVCSFLDLCVANTLSIFPPYMYFWINVGLRFFFFFFKITSLESANTSSRYLLNWPLSFDLDWPIKSPWKPLFWLGLARWIVVNSGKSKTLHWLHFLLQKNFQHFSLSAIFLYQIEGEVGTADLCAT